VTFGAWARLANLKANHRKVIIGDDGGAGLVGIVASANPHDGSSAHSNVAVRIAGPALAPLLASEMEVARFSGWKGVIAVEPARIAPLTNDSLKLEAGQIVRSQVITEGAIRDAVVEHIEAAVRGEFIAIAMFYISDRKVIDALVEAADRGVNVRLILDPNKDAFGYEKNGIPNRPVASELVAASNGAIHVRWYRTHGEQFHTKLVMVYGAERVWMSLGSANLTRRNIGDYNLEANVAIETARASPLGTQVLEYFETLWSNRAGAGIEYTADFGVYADPTQANYWLYRIMESTGLSTF
jgi:phosphatidylserine/phosphatidylglycerophosphate/cardiolipin synthase-like enzyme